MKKLVIFLIAATVSLASCSGDKKKETTPQKKEVQKEVVEKEKVVEKKTEATVDLAKGKELFSAKGCVACHNETSKIIGPSVVDIAKAYSSDEDLFGFLRGKSEAIVDTDPTQVSIMKNNIDTMVKAISDEDLGHIVAYMRSVK